jgi:arylsulfatase A-like enzyme
MPRKKSPATALNRSHGPTRRDVLRTGAAAALSAFVPRGANASRPVRPNFLFILCDQLHFEALSAYGNSYVRTPNLDRLVRRGTSFMQSHSPNPICCPARSCLLTGRMSTETSVTVNGLEQLKDFGLPPTAVHSNRGEIIPSIPNMGQWFEQQGYETVYCGKWHLPNNWAPNEIPGFTVLPVGGGEGAIVDPSIARATAAYLQSRSGSEPILFVSSLMQPHDICYFAIYDEALVPKDLPSSELEKLLPPLPANHLSRPPAPQILDRSIYTKFSELQWRYYLYNYYRQVEMLDATVGRILDALESSPHADNTMVIFTSDHGEGAAHHQHVEKWYPYDEALKVPLVVSCPGRIESDYRDQQHLVTGIDIVSTLCDYAGIPAPPNARGSSLRPLLERKNVESRDFVAAEVQVVGRVIRTPQYKYVRYNGDPVEQLFDMQADPGETRNLYADSRYASVVTDHRKLLSDWESKLIVY